MKTVEKIKLSLTAEQSQLLVGALEDRLDSQDPSEVGYGQDWRDKMNDLMDYIDSAACDVLGY
jgi:hypothetical protein